MATQHKRPPEMNEQIIESLFENEESLVSVPEISAELEIDSVKESALQENPIVQNETTEKIQSETIQSQELIEAIPEPVIILNVNEKTVWAKMPGYPWWPCSLLDESELPQNVLDLKRASHVPILFLGTYEYGWIQNNLIKPYIENRDAFTVLKRKNLDHSKAVREADDYNLFLKSYQDALAYKKPKTEPKKRTRKSEVGVESKKETPAKKRRLSEPAPKRAKRSAPETPVAVSENPVDTLMKYRVHLQKFLQTSNEARTEKDFERAEVYLSRCSDFPATVELLKETKIGKVVKKLDQQNIPNKAVSKACKELLFKWKSSLAGGDSKSDNEGKANCEQSGAETPQDSQADTIKDDVEMETAEFPTPETPKNVNVNTEIEMECVPEAIESTEMASISEDKISVSEVEATVNTEEQTTQISEITIVDVTSSTTAHAVDVSVESSTPEINIVEVEKVTLTAVISGLTDEIKVTDVTLSEANKTKEISETNLEIEKDCETVNGDIAVVSVVENAEKNVVSVTETITSTSEYDEENKIAAISSTVLETNNEEDKVSNTEILVVSNDVDEKTTCVVGDVVKMDIVCEAGKIGVIAPCVE